MMKIFSLTIGSLVQNWCVFNAMACKTMMLVGAIKVDCCAPSCAAAAANQEATIADCRVIN